MKGCSIFSVSLFSCMLATRSGGGGGGGGGEHFPKCCLKNGSLQAHSCRQPVPGIGHNLFLSQ